MSESDLHWVFAYGSNMNQNDLRKWLEGKGYAADGIKCVERAVLPGYKLIWNFYSYSRKGGAANVEPAEGQELPGVALLVDAQTLKALDKKEGHPNVYTRGDQMLGAKLLSGKHVKTWVYCVPPGCCRTAPVWPQRKYLHLLIEAAEEFRLPEWHISALRDTPTGDQDRPEEDVR